MKGATSGSATRPEAPTKDPPEKNKKMDKSRTTTARPKSKQKPVESSEEEESSAEEEERHELKKHNRKFVEEEDETTEKARTRNPIPYSRVPAVSPSTLPKGPPERGPKPKEGPNFKKRAPVENGKLGDKMIEKLMDLELGIQCRELLGLSPELRSELKKKVTKARITAEDGKNSSRNNRAIGNDLWDALMTEHDEEEGSESLPLYIDHLPMAQFWQLDAQVSKLPSGTIVCGDPVQQYLDALGPDEKPRKIVVALESASLRSVYPIINGLGEDEAVVDGGSQIVSMVESTARRLKLSWDPDVVINMQSANGTIEPTLGLSRNVPFLFDHLTVYLQVHIVRNAAYKVLLGRPFDLLTQSVISNSSDGDQLITLTDPNTNKRCVVPTYERGKPKTILTKEKSEVFHISRN